MIVRVIRQAKKAKRLTEVWVATDDQRIAETAEKAGAKAVMTPSSLPSGTDRIAYAVRNVRADIVVNIQGDEPVMPPAAVDAVVEVLQKDTKILMSTVVIPLTDGKQWKNPNVVKAVLGQKGNVLYFSRAPIPHPRDGGMPTGLSAYGPVRLSAGLAPTHGHAQTDSPGIDGKVGTIAGHGKRSGDPGGDSEIPLNRGGCSRGREKS